MITENDLHLGNGNQLHIYDSGIAGPSTLNLFWLHGTPSTGALPVRLLNSSQHLSIRWISFDRPGYGSSTPNPNRTVVSTANYVAQIADSLQINRFAVLGYSGGGPYALACGALLPDRVFGVASVSGPAPLSADGLDWFQNMTVVNADEFKAARAGRITLERYLQTATPEPEMFAPIDLAALAGEWSWFVNVVDLALQSGTHGQIDDDLALVTDWGFSLTKIAVPTLLLHGLDDQLVPSAHANWLARHIPMADLRLFPSQGHISILNFGQTALTWLRQLADEA